LTVLEEIAAERRRQIEAEGWTPEHDDTHSRGEMALAAACYADWAGLNHYLRKQVFPRLTWPWDLKWWKPTNRRRDLIKAAALIVAEVERLDRAKSSALTEIEENGGLGVAP